MSKKIELDAPCLGEIEKKYLAEAVDSGFCSSVGPFIPQFEQAVAHYLDVPCAVSVQSGTAALHMALYELGIGPGDEVIVPALTFIASINPILYVGATPVIVDVDQSTWTMDPVKMEQAITTKTKAVIPVHVYGNPCDMTAIMRVAEQRGLYVIEDATESLGAEYDGRKTGTWGDFGCFSFNGNKLITTGGGGMVVGRDPGRIAHIRSLINQSKDDAMPGMHREMGFNLRMTNIEAALGLAQFEQLGRFLRFKKQANEIYRDILASHPRVKFQDRYPASRENAWLTSITVDNDVDISHLCASLKTKGIPTRRMFMPADQMPYLKKSGPACSTAWDIYSRGLNLPSSTVNDPAMIKEAALAVREMLG